MVLCITLLTAMVPSIIAGTTPAAHPNMDKNKSPEATNGVNTQTVRVSSQIDVKAHCERARSFGAQIVAEPEQFFFVICFNVHSSAPLSSFAWIQFATALRIRDSVTESAPAD